MRNQLDIPYPGKLGANFLTPCRIEVCKSNMRDHDFEKNVKDFPYVFFNQLV